MINLTDKTTFNTIVGIVGTIATIVGTLVTLQTMGFSFALPWRIVLWISVGILVVTIPLWLTKRLKSSTQQPDPDQVFLDEVFEQFDSKQQALILLAQADRVTLSVKEQIEQGLQQRFGVENTFHLIPLQNATPETYFASLGIQCGLSKPIQSAGDLEMALGEKLQGDNIICLFISRLEKSDKLANEFASLLRNLLETTKLRVLLSGGQKLAELKFADGDLSLLNNADVKEYPELTVAHLQHWQNKTPAKKFNHQELQTLLAMTGGHPILLQRCLEYRSKNSKLAIDDYPQQLKQEPQLIAAFTRFQKNPQQVQQLREWLAQLDIMPAHPYIFDGLLREVYWLNLLVERNNRLVWRCEIVREVGESILKQD